MDRNIEQKQIYSYEQIVALRKESVDRNRAMFSAFSRSLSVALRKESVDRNKMNQKEVTTLAESLSARRAWIEIAPS